MNYLTIAKHDETKYWNFYKKEIMVLSLRELLACVWFSEDGLWISYLYVLKVQSPRSYPKLTESESKRMIASQALTSTIWEAGLVELEASQVALVVKNPPVNSGDIRDAGLIPGWRRSLEKGMATHSCIVAWRIPWTEEPGRLQSIGLQRVWHAWAIHFLPFKSQGDLIHRW